MLQRRQGRLPVKPIVIRENLQVNSHILTGYAGYFNRKHKRHGQLFQNRFKSIICQEESYLIELVRYIHLNPLRSKLVTNLEGLDRYRFCGHSVLMGNEKST